MTFKETMAKLFATSEGTYYKWRREHRPIILLLEKYFSKTELEEFVDFKQIKKLELIKNIDFEDLTVIIKRYEIKRIENIDIELLEEIDDTQQNIYNPNLYDKNELIEIYNKNHLKVSEKLDKIEKDMEQIKNSITNSKNS